LATHDHRGCHDRH